MDDASNGNNDEEAEVSVVGRSLDGRLSRPTSAWKSQRRRPNFTSLDGADDVDLEVLDLGDDGDSSDDSELVDLRNVDGQTRPTGNGNAFRSVNHRETDLIVPTDWISKSSPRTPRAWQDPGGSSDLQEFPARATKGLLVRRASGEATASECDTNSSTDTLGSARGRLNSFETKLGGAERRREFKELPIEEFSSTSNFFTGTTRTLERNRAEDGGAFPSKGGGGDALFVVGQMHDLRHPTRPSAPRETKQLPYSHLRQKLQPIERRTDSSVKAVDAGKTDVKGYRGRTRLRPLMTKRARALIFSLRQTDDRVVGTQASAKVTKHVGVYERGNAASRKAMSKCIEKISTELARSDETDERRLETAVTQLRGREEVELKQDCNIASPTPLKNSTVVRVIREDVFQERDGVIFGSNEPKSGGPSSDQNANETLDHEKVTIRSLAVGEHQANVQNNEEVTRTLTCRSTVGSELSLSRDRLENRPKFVGPECFESSTTLARSWKSPDPVVHNPSSRKTSSSPGQIFYTTHYSQFLPNDLNLGEFSLFDGDFTKSYRRPSSPEPSEDDVLGRPMARVPDDSGALTARPTAPVLQVPALRVSAASTVAATPREEEDESPSPSLALSLSFTASMIADDEELETYRGSGAPSSRINFNRRHAELAALASSSGEASRTASTSSRVEVPRISREGPTISKSLVRSVSFADEPFVVPQSMQVDSAPAPSERPAVSSTALSLLPSPPKLAPSRVASSPRTVAPSRPTVASLASPRPAAVANTKQSPITTHSEAQSLTPSVFSFSPLDTLPLVPSKVLQTTQLESTMPSPPKRDQSIPSEPVTLASKPLYLVPSYASPKSDGLTFNNAAMCSPWGQQSLADMWNEAKQGLNQVNDKTSFL